MTSLEPRRSTGRTWAIVGGTVLAGGVVALLVGIFTPRGVSVPTVSSATPLPATPPEAVVDAGAVGLGWTPEPITTDPETYARAALAAASTFDTTTSSRDDWLDYLNTWFTPDVRYAEDQRADRMKAAHLELRQGVVLPQETWNSMAAQKGRVATAATGDVDLRDVPNDPTGQMHIATADVSLTFTQADGTGQESSYTEYARVSVQILCGSASVPTPDSAQRSGDCKVVRYFTEPLEI